MIGGELYLDSRGDKASRIGIDNDVSSVVYRIRSEEIIVSAAIEDIAACVCWVCPVWKFGLWAKAEYFKFHLYLVDFIILFLETVVNQLI